MMMMLEIVIVSHCRQHMILAKQKSLEEAKEREAAAEQDLFSDMAPTIKRQKKVFVGERNGAVEQGSRLRAVEHDPLVRNRMIIMMIVMIMMRRRM